MNIKIPAQFRGTYEFILKRKDGSVQKETVHNIATSNIVNATHSSSLSIGSGSGTPSSADTKLFNHKWNISASVVSHVQNIGEDGASMNMTYIVPATTSYVAVITEVGMGEPNSIYTHAMLVDAEGNPISIIKTENDELTINVTLELYTSTTLPLTMDFAPFVSVSRKPTLAALLLSHIVNSHRYITVLTGDDDKSTNYRSALMLSICPRNLLLPYRTHSSGVDPEYLPFNGNKSMMRKELVGNLRCRNNSFNTHYYRYLQFSLAWYYSGYTHVSIPMALDLKNPDIFPPQLLSNIAIGVGDGSTAEFACPLNYFKKDTEVIYKNGVALTRGVDYTIDNESNKDCLPELMHILYPDDAEIKITSGPGVQASGPNLQFLAEANVTPPSYATYDYSKVCTAFNAEYPLHFDWGVARKVNCLKGVVHVRYAKTLHVEYSTDNATWDTAAILDVQNSSTSSIKQYNVDVSWDPIEARYWRIRVERYGTSTSSNHIAYFSTGGAAAYLGYSNPRGIVFTTPPAETDVLTMDCYLDIPLKSTNFAFNLALDLNLTYS